MIISHAAASAPPPLQQLHLTIRSKLTWPTLLQRLLHLHLWKMERLASAISPQAAMRAWGEGGGRHQ